MCVRCLSGPGQKMRRSAGSAEARCVGWGLGPWMWAAQAAGMASRSRAISCCWAGCAAPDLRRSRKCSTEVLPCLAQCSQAIGCPR